MAEAYSASSGWEISIASDKVSEDFGYQLHSHEGIYEILYMLQGDSSFWVEGTSYRMQRGDLVIARSDEMHLMRHRSRCVYERLVINVNKEYFLLNNCQDYLKVFDMRPVGVGNHFSAEALREGGVTGILERLEEYLVLGEKPLIQSALTELLYHLNTLSDRDGLERGGVVHDIVMYINENITQPLTLDLLSEQFYISKYYMCRQFKKRIGMSIAKYITHKRIMLVRELYSSGKNLTEACIDAGFGDYSSFYVAYKKLTGTSPRADLR